MFKKPRRVRSASHWGAYRLTVDRDKFSGVEPFEHDPGFSAFLDSAVEMTYASNRIMVPHVRKGWLEGDGGEGRGRDSYVEIDWEQALDLLARELSRIRAEHGDDAIFGGSYGWSSAGRIHHARSLLHRFLAGGGGFTGQKTNYSFGAAMSFIPHVVGEPDGIGRLTPFAQIAENAEVMLAFGGLPAKNWQIQSGGSGLHALEGNLANLVRHNVKVVTVSPYRGDAPNIPNSEFIPIKPNTDCALVLSLIYVLIERKIHSSEFIEKYTSGFDSLADYLFGRADGVRKSPAWASGITGVPENVIESLAVELAGRPNMITATWSLQRARNGEQPYWAIIALASALGTIGLAGQGYGFGYGSMNGMGDPGYRTPIAGLPALPNPVACDIPVARVADMLLKPGQRYRYNFETRLYPDIKLVYWVGGNPFHHHQDLSRLSKAFRQPQFVAVHEICWNATARHADLVLPATTTLERNDLGGSSRDPFILAMHQAIEPQGLSRNDFDIFRDLACRLNYENVFTEGRSSDEWVQAQWNRSRKLLAERGIEAPEFDEFWEVGYFRLPEPLSMKAQFADFRDNPVANPLKTRSGRIMIALPEVAAEGLPPHPAWLPPDEFLGSKVAERYPLHLLTPQPSGRLHSQAGLSAASCDRRVDGYEVVRINIADAGERNIRSGDVVELFNDRGSCRAVAEVDDSVRRGVVLLPTGADYYGEYLPANDALLSRDRGSNPNVLTADVGTSVLGQGCAAQSCLVEIRVVSADTDT